MRSFPVVGTRQMACHARTPQHHKRTKKTHLLYRCRPDITLIFQGRSKPYLYSQLRMVSPHFFPRAVRVSVQRFSPSVLSPGARASRACQRAPGRQEAASPRAHTHTRGQRTRTHTRRENEQTIKVSDFSTLFNLNLRTIKPNRELYSHTLSRILRFVFNRLLYYVNTFRNSLGSRHVFFFFF